MKPLVLGLVLALIACNEQPAGEPVMRTEIGKGSEEMAAARRALSPCQPVTFDALLFTHCVADPSKHRIKMVLGDDKGEPYRSLRAYGESLGIDAVEVAFAFNGGMFDGDGLPIGYYVENGERLQELNRNDGPGNFHLKPNGVFFGTDGSWQVMTSESFYAQIGDRPGFGTQSGPMLVIGGEIHPEIAVDGPSKAIRNAVGIDTEGKAHFLIAEVPVSFGIMARVFRDDLGTPNALFLDGNVSALWDPAAERLDVSAPLGPLIVVTNKE
jgi:uncharacterized protein YigE (DUF2233 family)